MIHFFTQPPKISQKKVNSRLKFKGEGIECEFFTVKKTGYKVYRSLMEAYKAFERQSKAYKAGLAPRPGKMFVQLYKDGTPTYGYTTQIAKIINGNRYSDTRYNQLIENMEEISRKLRKIGILTRDLHDGNFGYIGKRLVCIDFGSESCR